MYGLNIHLQSFNLKRSIAHGSDKIRVSITTIPEERKEAFVIEASKMKDVHHFFTVNVDKNTQKIIFVFRKKSFLNNDPIIASTVVRNDELPQSANDTNNTEMKTINIFEPISGDKKSFYSPQNRKVFGQMHIQFTPTEPFPAPSFKDSYNHYKKNNSTRISTYHVTSVNNKSYGSYGYQSNENQNQYQNYYNNSNYSDQNQLNDQYSNQKEFQDPQQQNQYEQQEQYEEQDQYQQDQYPQQQNQYQQQQNQYQQQQNQYPQQQNQYQQQQNQYPQQQYQQQQQNQYQQQYIQQNQYQQQQNQYQTPNPVFVDNLI